MAIVTDAWHPQVNGVVRTLSAVAQELVASGMAVEVIEPGRFRTVPCPTYPEIRLALLPARRLRRMLDAFQPDAVHVATEGPLGWAARRWAQRRRLHVTTSLHTRFPDYVQARIGLPSRYGWAVLRAFHGAADGTLVATRDLRDELQRRGFRNVRLWSRGVDTATFAPERRTEWDLPRPVFLYAGRVAVEKNVAAFLELDLPGSKVVVGDGPQLAQLRQRFPGVHFAGALFGTALAGAYAAADAFVFPSRTDTFGLVMLESMACGTPVAAFPASGPRSVVAPGTGVLNEDLRQAALEALEMDRAACRAYAVQLSWAECARVFASHLVPLHGGSCAAPSATAGTCQPA